jgi:hypothetical protein
LIEDDLEVQFKEKYAEGELAAIVKQTDLGFKELGGTFKGAFNKRNTKDDVDAANFDLKNDFRANLTYKLNQIESLAENQGWTDETRPDLVDIRAKFTKDFDKFLAEIDQEGDIRKAGID